MQAMRMLVRGDYVMPERSLRTPHKARRAVNLFLDLNVLTRARQFTDNLSTNVEELLKDYVVQEQARRPNPTRRSTKSSVP